MLYIFSMLLCTACTTGGIFAINTPSPKNNGNHKLQYPQVIEESEVRKHDRLTDIDLTKYLKKQGIKIGDMEAKEMIRSFLDERFSKTNNISLVTFTSSGNSNGGMFTAIYTQLYQHYSIANGYGVLRIDMNKHGMLKNMYSTLIPEHELPEQPEFNKEKVLEMMLKRIGNEFQYSTIAGTVQTWRLNSKDEIKVLNPVVYPKLIGTQLNIHIAYPVIVGNALSWTVFIDAINGSELDVKPNFVS